MLAKDTFPMLIDVHVAYRNAPRKHWATRAELSL
jgi:hypothetical protein